MKTCTKCKQIKDFSQFYKDKRATDKCTSDCKKCHLISTSRWKRLNLDRANLASRNHYKANIEKKRKYNKEYRIKNPDKYRNTWYKYEYGISLDDYNIIFNLQKGLCNICNKHQNEFKRKLAVDHCHTTGKIRGLLCKDCNTAIGLLKDNIQIIKKAIEHLS